MFIPAFAGWFDDLLSRVLKAILTPVMELVGFLLRTILGPILEAVLKPVMQFLIEIIMTVMASVFYTILKSLLEIVYTIESSFLMFSGIGTVSYNGNDTTLLEIFVTQNSVLSRAFWLITFLCLALCLVFTIIAVTRSTFDFDYENKRPIGKVLGAAGKSMLTFFLIPVFVMFTISLTTIVMRQVYAATSVSGLSVADTVFQISVMTANRDPAHKLSGSDQTFTNGIRESYNRKPENPRDWGDIKYVEENFHLNKIDYVIGFGLSVFMLYILATIAFTFVQRIFEIMLLYIGAPFFVSSMPLDDGQKFTGWRNLFIGKMISGMGIIVMVNLYLMAVMVMMGDSIILDPRSLNDAATGIDAKYVTYDYLLKIIFVAGGALAVKNGGSMLTQLVDYQAGSQEQNTVAQTGSMVGRVGAFAGGAALAIGAKAGKAALAPVKFAGSAARKGVQYGLTKKIMSNDGSKTTNFLQGAYSAGKDIGQKADSVREGFGKVKSFATGNFAEAFKSNGQETQTSKRLSALQNGNMVDFIKQGRPEAKAKQEKIDKINKSDETALKEAVRRPWE